jgi:Hemerythrin HHE cation binding domain
MIMETRDNAARPDEYRFIHKALRLFMADTLAAVGRMDPADPSDIADTIKQVRDLLASCRSHLEHENAFVHTSMEARAPGSAARIANEHVHHRDAIGDLARDTAVLEESSGPARMAAADALYSKLALFIGENFVHMHTEETENNAVIWATHSDQDILSIHRAIMAALTPDEMASGARWMIAALNPPQRAALLSEIRQSAPPPVFEGLLGMAKAHLSDLEWRKLAQAMTQRAAA